MSNQPNLESLIRSALERVARHTSEVFDATRYGRAFHASAQSKAKTVIEALSRDTNPFRALDPVFVSVGGADGEELDFLLSHTAAQTGVLIEKSRDLAEIARKRALPNGKSFEIFEGDATDIIKRAIEFSSHLVRTGRAGYQVITCHAVIHELFDRSRNGFDPPTLFATIFGDPSIPTWFTYREPGTPAKWPEQVLVSAECSPATLLELAQAICLKHQSLRELEPQPLVIGDHLRVHRDVAMELIVKLFYLEDLEYELQERSTSVNHQHMESYLLLAIGDKAYQEGRANVTSASFPTDSFQQFWQKLGIRVAGLKVDASRFDLSVAESQTRVIAWRTPAGLSVQTATPSSEAVQEKLGANLSTALDALNSNDEALLEALLISKGRSWIEQDQRPQALKLLETLRAQYPRERLMHVWSHYLLSLSQLFSGSDLSTDLFSDQMERAAEAHGLDVLFLAERMEFARKRRDDKLAILSANELARRLSPLKEVTSQPALRRYAVGTAFFVFANFLRAGGSYGLALESLDIAESWLMPGIESQDTERLHCFYARSVCGGIQGSVSFKAPFKQLSDISERFAGALIQLTYSNAAWFVDDLARAEQHAADAAKTFDAIEAVKYKGRALTTCVLLNTWQDLEMHQAPQFGSLDEKLKQGILFLAGQDNEPSWFRDWFRMLRPSVAAGVLQFRRFSKTRNETSSAIELPPLLFATSEVHLEWQSLRAKSFDEAEMLLRRHLGAPEKNRIPLWAD